MKSEAYTKFMGKQIYFILWDVTSHILGYPTGPRGTKWFQIVSSNKHTETQKQTFAHGFFLFSASAL